jgi:hypothetical protein
MFPTYPHNTSLRGDGGGGGGRRGMGRGRGWEEENGEGTGGGFGLVVRAAGWHAGDPGSIFTRDGLYTFGCIPPAP